MDSKNLKFFSLNFLFRFIFKYEYFACIYVCPSHVCLVLTGQEASDPLELLMVSALKTEPRFSASVSAPNGQTISPAPEDSNATISLDHPQSDRGQRIMGDYSQY